MLMVQLAICVVNINLTQLSWTCNIQQERSNISHPSVWQGGYQAVHMQRCQEGIHCFDGGYEVGRGTATWEDAGQCLHYSFVCSAWAGCSVKDWIY